MKFAKKGSLGIRGTTEITEDTEKKQNGFGETRTTNSDAVFAIALRYLHDPSPVIRPLGCTEPQSMAPLK